MTQCMDGAGCPMVCSCSGVFRVLHIPKVGKKDALIFVNCPLMREHWDRLRPRLDLIE
jgi:hypothetical protein